VTTTASYLSDLSRVRVSFTGLSSLADYAIVERSVNGGLTWELVRGGDSVPVTAGAGHLDDYEFANGSLNTYRVTAINAEPQAWIGSGGPVSANNATVTPFCHASTAIGDLVLIYASIRNSGAGQPVQPTGWTTIVDMGNVKVFGRYATSAGSTGQAVTFTGGVANADTIAQMTTFRNTDIAPAGTPATLTNASAQNIAYPAATPSVAGTRAVVIGWKQDDWSSAPVITGWDSEAGQLAVTAGDDMGQVWWQRAKTSTSQQPSGSFTITGGAAAISKAAMFFLPPRAFTDQETTSITPVENRTMFKIVTRPSLNFEVEIIEVSDISRPSRTAIHRVQGRTLPVSVSDVQGSRQFQLDIDLLGFDNIEEVDLRLASGEPLYIQMPPGDHFVPTCYVILGDIDLAQDAKGSQSMTYRLPMTEVARPGLAIFGDTYIWSDVVTDYATWSAILAEPVATWADLIDKVGTSEVIVP
jgi:hypothetical protein